MASRITIFGATGGVGRHVVSQALGAAHPVTAFARNPDAVHEMQPDLQVVGGQLADRDAVRRAVHGADAIISALGPSLDRKATGMPLVVGTRNILDAMHAEGVRRFIGMATPSLRDPRDERSLLGAVVPVMGRLMLPRAYRELLAMSELITASDLDWTIARFTRPTNGEPTGNVRAGFLGRDKIGASITRADIAGFLLDQVADERFHCAAPAISG
jgi:nucleoside-diphosphate-sugar epimerase